MNDSDPKALETLVSAYTPRPAMAAPTRITLATPITTPSSVRKLLSLCARSDSSAMRKELLNRSRPRIPAGVV